MTDDYLRQAKDQLDRDLVPGHPLRRVVDELIEMRHKVYGLECGKCRTFTAVALGSVIPIRCRQCGTEWKDIAPIMTMGFSE